MSQRTETWLAEIDRLTHNYKEQIGDLSGNELNRKPNAKTWSIGQIIEHVIILNESYYPVIKKVREENYSVPFIGRFDFITSIMGKMLLNANSPDRKRKMKTFSVWEPSSSTIRPDILSVFENHQSELKELISDCRDLVERGVVISSPANKYIVYRLDSAFDIILSHEARHLEQVKETKELLER